MDTESSSVPFRPRSSKAASIPLIPEIETYLHLLIVIHLIDTKCYKKVSTHNIDAMYL